MVRMRVRHCLHGLGGVRIHDGTLKNRLNKRYLAGVAAVLAVAAIGSGVLRLVLRERSPWKIRSVPFDACCGIGFGVALLALYLSILLLNH